MKYITTKEDNIFIVSNKLGNIPIGNNMGYGLYTYDTRFLSGLELKVNNRVPIFLSARDKNNYINKFFLTNQEFEIKNKIVPKDTIGIKRSRFINKILYEKIELSNYNSFPVIIELSLKFTADYRDILHIREFAQKNNFNDVKLYNNKSLLFSYQGDDNIVRKTNITFRPNPLEIQENELKYRMNLNPRENKVIYLNIDPIYSENKDKKNYKYALKELKNSYSNWKKKNTKITTDNKSFNSLLERSRLDLRTLMTDFGEGYFPAAGIPWYVCPFGRDGIITALQMMLLNTDVAKSVLRTLANYQGEEVNSERDEEPGKIFHELRFGEMANLDIVPHSPYYGTADATPLFLILISKYYQWTADISLVREMLPAIKKALEWINNYGDLDGDDLIEYRGSPDLGYEVQVWKDSQDSMRFHNGKIAKSPMAVSEVQGYVYKAKKDLAPILKKIGEKKLSQRLIKEAQELKIKFNKEFWLDDKEFYALALDKNKEKVASITSDIGQCLWTEIIADDKAKNVVEHLMDEDMFSGWGVRTMSKIDQGYNPLSYHNGSVWPHDNSLIALGIKKYGYGKEANKLFSGILSASKEFKDYRLPELFCGFDKKEGVIDYPIACSPQAWAAATPYLLFEAILGLKIDIPNNIIYLNPTLPSSVNEIEVKNLKLGEQIIDFKLTQVEDEIKLNKLSDCTVDIIII